jgi:nickel/cobalt transporter (NicO) family protein
MPDMSSHPRAPAARTLDTMGRRRSLARRALGAVLAVGLIAAVPAAVLAHPLGNFTINHYAGIRVEPDRILLDVVIDQAEIPTFQARFDFDTDGDASLSDEEIDAGRITACDGLASSLALSAGGSRLTPRLTAAGLSFPLGVGGLSTMREVCSFEAPLLTTISDRALDITFVDRSFAERTGWREIVAQGSGVTLTADGGELRQTSVSQRLTRYPQDLITSPLRDRSLALRATVGGATLAPLDIPDASKVAAVDPAPPAPAASPAAAAPSPAPAATPDPVAAAVPGGVGAADLPDIFRQTDLTPVVVLLSLLAAGALGAGHALTPGHGKTLMAAYLVGTRGSARHAIGLGAAVSVSHTVGILVLAAVVLAATDVVAPDVIVRGAPLVAAISIVVIGGWMLLGEVRRRRGARPSDHGHHHDHDHDHGDARDHASDQAHPHDAHGHSHAHPHPHMPASSITWRSLFVLGLAGGLIPSTSALLMLLGAIAAGRPAFGLVLVVAFGLGMAAVMSGVGLVLVTARDRVDRVQAGIGLGRFREAIPLVAAVVVLGFGVVLTGQAWSVIQLSGL